MARKRLTKGTNALRVEERIARVPADLSSPRPEGSGVFEALKLLELRPEEEGQGPRLQPEARPPAPIPAAKAVPGRAPKGTPEPPVGPEKHGKLGPDSFTKAERRAIVVSCTEYRNRLPTYLKSAMREVEVLDSILRKCERADKDLAEGAGP